MSTERPLGEAMPRPGSPGTDHAPGHSPARSPTPGTADDATAPLPVMVETLADGRYQLGPILGSGGMGLVRRASDGVLEREVAVKLLADNLAADPDARERFLREARAAARITDPHVVAVYDVGEEAGRPYLVMELVDGPSLADVLRSDGPLPPAAVLDIAAGALAGLVRAHAAGLLHRDVKPGNLLRSPDGRVRLTDFGVAEAADAPGLTNTGFVIGTKDYLAPERRRGEPASPASDLYALGVTLAELSTGRPPEPGEEPSLPPQTPRPLRHLLEATLHVDPSERPSSAAAALALLDPATGAPTDVSPRGWRSVSARLRTGPGRSPSAGASRSAEGGDGRVASSRPSRRWLPAAVVGLAVVAALGFGMARAGDDPDPAGGVPPTEAPAEGTAEGPAPTSPNGADVPAGGSDDPAGTVRDLAEWLRDAASD
jgi:eukaryotic-like serine/threonine-protein kinase